MSDSLGTRLRAARKNQGLSRESVGNRFGISAQAVQQWEKDRTVPDPDRLSTVAGLYGVSLEWLITGRNIAGAGIGSVTHVSHLKGRVVPKISLLEAKSKDYLEKTAIATVHTHFPCSAQSYCITITDRSNAPLYSPGDEVIIDPEITAEPGDMVLAEADGLPEPVFRRVRFLRGGVLVLVPLNDVWPEIEVSKENPGSILGVMSEHAIPRRSSSN